MIHLEILELNFCDLNENTRKNRIPRKIKRQGIDNKLELIYINDEYIKKIKIGKSNPFKNTNYLKYINLNVHQIKFNKNKLFEKIIKKF